MIRTFLLAGAVLGTLWLGGSDRGLAEAAKPPVRLGILTVFDAFGADYAGKGSLAAARLAVEDAGGTVAGRPIEIVSADTLQKADVASAVARRWFERDGVDAIFDLPNSSAALAVIEVARPLNKIVVTGQAGALSITGKACAPTAMQWVFDSYNLSAGTARAVLRRGGDSWFLLVTDFAFGHDMAQAARGAIEAGGGKVLGSVSHPLASADLSSFLLQAQASKAKIIGLAEGPPDTFNAIRQGLEFGVAAGGQTIVPFLAEITDIHAMGLATAQGIMLTTGFYWDMDDDTRAWSRRYFAEVGAMPTMFQAGLYSAIRHYLKAVEAAGTTEGLAVAERMRALPVEDFFAKHGRIRPDGRMEYPMYLAEVKSPAESKYPWDYLRILEMIPLADAYRPLAQSDCPLVRHEGQ